MIDQVYPNRWPDLTKIPIPLSTNFSEKGQWTIVDGKRESVIQLAGKNLESYNENKQEPA